MQPQLLILIVIAYNYCKRQSYLYIKCAIRAMEDKSYLHHQYDRVERDQKHNKVLKLGGNNQLPDAVLYRFLVVRNISAHRPSIDSKVNALFL